MTLTILVSFSLLALVVTARPILPRDAQELVGQSRDVQNAVQAIFQSRQRRPPECLGCDGDEDVHVHVTSSEEQNAYLSRLDGLDAVKAIVPLDLEGTLTDDEKHLYDILTNSKAGGRLDDLDGGERPLQQDDLVAESENALSIPPNDDTAQESLLDSSTNAGNQDVFTSPPLLVLALSCIAALLALLCVTLVLCTAHYFHSKVLSSHMTWELMPRLEKRTSLGHTMDDESQTLVEEQLLDLKDKEDREDLVASLVINDEKTEELQEDAGQKMPPTAERDLSSDEEFDEKYEDAQESSLLLIDSEIPPRQDVQEFPRIVIEEHSDPDFLPLPSSPTPFFTPTASRSPSRSPLRRPLQMREMSTTSPVSKPAWSLRAANSPSLGLARPSTPRLSPDSSPRIPGALYMEEEPSSADQTIQHDMVDRPGRRRAYRAPIPELDIAFALQLRPGLGLGADPAWLVRFLMAMFGWMTVLIGGTGPRRASQERT
ncbi:hypothetical protein AcV5_009906 [Taiwanofungus camphoratus]|nr:hypothetical protein AcV5_009906 [Antrodia cinnamomea]